MRLPKLLSPYHWLANGTGKLVPVPVICSSERGVGIPVYDYKAQPTRADSVMRHEATHSLSPLRVAATNDICLESCSQVGLVIHSRGYRCSSIYKFPPSNSPFSIIRIIFSGFIREASLKRSSLEFLTMLKTSVKRFLLFSAKNRTHEYVF